jgi:hypothetical protein
MRIRDGIHAIDRSLMREKRSPPGCWDIYLPQTGLGTITLIF